MDGERCAFCSAPLADGTAAPCAGCGAPQSLTPAEDAFALLGAPRTFAQDRVALEKSYYARSRAMHPDRFAASSDPAWKRISSERMSALNEAYRTLTDPEARRAYVLERAGVATDAKAPPPSALAEAWFELQDAATDDPAAARGRVEAFARELEERAGAGRAAIRAAEARYDADPGDRGALAEIAARGHELRYLKSLERDLLRLRSGLGI